jgi:hypothetical protein
MMVSGLLLGGGQCAQRNTLIRPTGTVLRSFATVLGSDNLDPRHSRVTSRRKGRRQKQKLEMVSLRMVGDARGKYNLGGCPIVSDLEQGECRFTLCVKA